MRRIALFAAGIISFAAAQEQADSSTANSVFHITAGLVYKTIDQKASEKNISSVVEAMGGWLLNQTPQQIRFRLPKDSVDGFLKMLDSTGVTTDATYARSDFTADYFRLVAGLQAKEYLLKQYLAVLDSSGTEGIYPVSREIADLQNSIELLKGRMRGMIERMEFAEVWVSFNFIDRRVPVVSGNSDFEWLNSVDLPSLLEDFR